jgi:hypothetical protein
MTCGLPKVRPLVNRKEGNFSRLKDVARVKIAIAALGSDDHPSSFCRLDHDAKYLQGVVQGFSDDAACVEAMRR